ncbi:MAG: hypothetical protein ACXAEU_04975 [Candidatus Hodarchaeales archaeon]|jgi:hypothetical protein
MSSKSIRLDLDDKIREDLLLIKKFLGIRSNADIVRWLITEKAREIKQSNVNID